MKLLQLFEDGIKCLENPSPSSVDLSSFWDFPPILSSVTRTDSQVSHLPHPWVSLHFSKKGCGKASMLHPGMSENAWVLCLYLGASLGTEFRRILSWTAVHLWVWKTLFSAFGAAHAGYWQSCGHLFIKTGASSLLTSLGHTRRRRVVLGHTLNKYRNTNEHWWAKKALSKFTILC